ncbi:MAG: chemotaxis protein CheA [Gammaproteobacteria bacterium]
MSIDISQFHQTFFEESFEGLDVMESGLLNLDCGTVDEETINAIFRAAHSIKGGSATFGFTAVASFTHAMETLLDEMRDGHREVTQESVDVLLKAVDCLRELVVAQRDSTAVDEQQVAQVQGEIETLLGKATAPEKDSADSASGAQCGDHREWLISFHPHTHLLQSGNDPALLFRELSAMGELEVTVDISRLPQLPELDPEQCHLSWELKLTSSADESAIREIFEWVEDDCDLSIQQAQPTPKNGNDADAKAAAVAVVQAPKTAPSRKPVSTESGSIRVSIDKVDNLINMVGELVITQSMMGNLDGGFDDFDISRLEQLREGLALLERNTRELQESVMRIRMLPISFVFSRFPRMVHDLSQQLGKKIDLVMSGEQTELDKTVMEKIGDPLVHLIRNSIDHGIEAPETRSRLGKPETGTVHLNAYHKGGNIVIEINDDGAGFNKQKIIAKARERGLIDSDTQLADENIYDLIFQPGFSTAEMLSDVSGRGVGMDVVRRNIRELGGTIETSSREGEGTTFTIRLPLTLAILDGQLVRVGSETFIIPLVSIVESLQIRPENVNSIAGKSEVYKLREEYMPILHTHEIFQVDSDPSQLNNGLLVVIEGDGQKAGLFVDDLLGQQQVVIKSLETNFQRISGISGATILGNGTVALILDVEGLVQLSRKSPHGKPEFKERAVA